jgi:CDP-diacylglycerol--glycerol-3-phosphate 3-phosphatidyltransferase
MVHFVWWGDTGHSGGPMNFPNQLTVGRLGLCALFVAAFSLEIPYAMTAALVIFVLASLTDWLDGHLARKWNEVTDLGKLLDPLADKVLISAALIGLLRFHVVPMWMVVAIITREFLITGLRTLAASKGYIMEAEKLGKHKTISQIVVILTSLILVSLRELRVGETPLEAALELALPFFFWITLVITVGSGAMYFYKNRALLTQEVTGGLHD